MPKEINQYSSAEIETVFDAAISTLKKHNLSVTPENYTLFYDYASGSNAELRNTINKIISSGEEFTDEFLRTLYSEILGKKESSELNKLGTELQTIVQSVFQQVIQLEGAAGNSSEKFSKSIEHLSENSSYSDIFEAVKVLSSEAKELGNLGSKIRDELLNTSKELDEARTKLDNVTKETRIDHLTGIANRLGLDETLTSLIGDVDFSVLMIDIDHFKLFNDKFGHLIGDKVLRFVAKTLTNQVKGGDFVSRFGGEEFIVLLPNTPIEDATIVAENIRKYFANANLKGHGNSQDLGKVTVSIGVSHSQNDEEIDDLIERVDTALYKAKNSGRNRVERG